MLISWARCGHCWEPSGPAAVGAEVAIFSRSFSFLGPCPPRIALHLYLHPFPLLPGASAPISEYLHSWFPLRFPLPPQTPRPPASRPRGPNPAWRLSPQHPQPSQGSRHYTPVCSPLGFFILSSLPPPGSPLPRPGQPACRCP